MRTLANLISILVCLFCTLSTSAQSSLRLDVDFEGPWLFYQQAGFSGSQSALIAIAPNVPGHYPPTFSTGDGTTLNNGIYCLGFDSQTCTTTSVPTLDKDSYADPSLVPVYRPDSSWNWASLGTQGYVLILPMPDSYSSDGQFNVTFMAALTSPAMPDPVPTYGPEAHSIGVQLHYVKGPKQITLLQCSSGDPATCGQPQMAPNSGTLQIHIKAPETSNMDPCPEYHVHLAYHKMISLLDPLLKRNAQRAFIDVPAYSDGCRPCEPQQDMLSIDCMYGAGVGNVIPIFNVPKGLLDLIDFVDSAKFAPQDKNTIIPPSLRELGNQLKGKLPSVSQLTNLIKLLNLSETAIQNLSLQPAAKGNAFDPSSKRMNFQVVISKEQALARAAAFMIMAALDGKDCRVVEFLIQD